jgi:hypothetical protein
MNATPSLPSLLWQDAPTKTRRALATLLLLAAFACSDRDAPRPVPVPDQDPASGSAPPISSRETPPPAVGTPGAAAAPVVDPDDPAEPGIPDLARLARYVFKTMQRHEEVCPFENPVRERLHVALAVDVRKGRITRVGTGHVGVEPEKGGEARTLAAGQVPRALTAYVTCLAPHLQAVTMAPSPADGVYEPVYTFGGQASGQPAP